METWKLYDYTDCDKESILLKLSLKQVSDVLKFKPHQTSSMKLVNPRLVSITFQHISRTLSLLLYLKGAVNLDNSIGN